MNIDFDEKEVELSIAEKMKELFDSKYKYEYTQEKKLLTYAIFRSLTIWALV